jgi:lysophospholipase L1-like esterase
LVGKSVYAFGDSIVYGHVYPHSFVDVVAEREGMSLTKFARNGATIGADAHASGGQILTQVEQATDIAPDFVIFDGGTNDAQSIFRDRAYTLSTYVEELEKTSKNMVVSYLPDEHGGCGIVLETGSSMRRRHGGGGGYKHVGI